MRWIMSSSATNARWVVIALVAVAAASWAFAGGGAGTGAGSGPLGTPTPEPAADVKALVGLRQRGAPVAEQRAALERYLTGRGVSTGTLAAVLRHTRDGIALLPGPRSAQTRIGGPPLLPPGEGWPQSDGHPFTFVAAIDFAELPQTEALPRAGTLALYWNFNWVEGPQEGPGHMDFVAGTRAYFFAPGAPVAQPDPPRSSFPVGRLPLRGVVMPFAGEPGLVAQEVEGRPDREKLFAAMNDLTAAGLYPHHLLGAPIEVQGPVLAGMPAFFDPKQEYLTEESRARFTAAERDAGEWVLLAQLNEDKGFVIADGGVLHFVILRSDLAAGRFDRVVGIMESH